MEELQEETALAPKEKSQVRNLGSERMEGMTCEVSSPKKIKEDSELRNKLKTSGLDPDYWLIHFMTELSISNCAQIQHLKDEHIEKLIPHRRQDWEIDALKKLIESNRNEPTDDNATSATKEMVNNIKDKLSSKSFAEDTKKKVTDLRKEIRIEDNQWIAAKASVDFNKEINMLQQSDGSIHLSRNKLDDNAVIQHASGGRVLMGVSVDQDLVVTKEHNNTVIQLHGEIKMKGPSMGKKEEFVETRERQKNDSICKSLSTDSNEYKAALNVGYQGFGLSLEGSKQNVENFENQTTENYEEIFFRKEKRAFIPVKSCEIKLENIKFETNALNELKNIEKQYKETKDCETVMSLCSEFLENYGSHFNIGILHFGGIYKWIAKCNMNAKFERVSAQKIVSDALEGFVSLGFSGSKWGVGAGVSGSCLKSRSNLDDKYSESELSNIHLNIDPDGGPPEEGDFQKWKQIMVSNNETWSLIDRNIFCGLWRVISNHQDDFDDYRVLAALLECAWKVGAFKYSLNNTSSVNYIELLKILCTAFEQLSVWLNANEYVRNFIKSNSEVQDFFDRIAKSKDLQEQTNNRNMKHLLTFVLVPMKQVFISNRQNLMNWISIENESREDVQDLLSPENIIDINEFLAVLKVKFIPYIRTFDSAVRNENQQTTDQYVTKEFTKACMHLLKSFREHDKEQFCIFRSFLQKFGYKEDKGFSFLLTVLDLDGFVQDVELCMEHYKKTDKQHVHLLHLIVSNLLRYKSETSTAVFDLCYEILKGSLNEQIKTTIERNISSSSYYFEQLLLDLKQHKDNMEEKELIFSLPVEKILDVKPIGKEPSFAMLSKDNEHLKNFLEKIGLMQYFPNKLRFADAIKIDSTFTKKETKSLPWFLLENILMQNSSVFESLEKHVTRLETPSHTSDEETNDIASGNFGFLNFLIEAPKESFHINPLDLMVGVFACCSQQLKQVIASKMHACRLAIPVVLPHEPSVFAMSSLRPILTSAVDCPCNVVSFMRIGRPKFSKSRLLNDFLSKEYHDTFFNHKSPLGRTERTVSNGVVESSFLVEQAHGTQKQNLKLLLNLRGNSCQYELQRNMITTISSAVIILTTVEDLERTEISAHLDTIRTKVQVLIALDAISKTKNELIEFTKVFMLEKPEISFVILTLKDHERRKQDIVTEIKTILNRNKSAKHMVISQILDHSPNYQIDENHEHVFEKAAAQQVISELPSNILSVTKGIMPLQLDHLHLLSQNIKKIYKPSEYKTQLHKQEIKRAIFRIRTEQLKLIPEIHPFMISFLNKIMQLSEFDDGCIMFALWIKTLIEHKTRECKNQSFVSGTGSETTELDSFFGFEHLIRELGQIYEAVIERKSMVDNETYQLAMKFPYIPAKLLLMGLPFELMNGDITHVPITWVKAVLKELERLIGNEKCLILSVVGVQSSGKSTLLNTMFKLQFPVGHGRVTKGAFMQLLRVEDEDLPFRFVMVIDTEGLRAPELGDQNYIHDTEFATFVIGLADINIVNIFGEISLEMNEVLQMVVHTLLRLKLTKKIDLKQSCVFVHQNVTSDDTDNTLPQMLKKFVSSLNKKTEESAIGLDIMDIHAFSDVIDFDAKNVWYLPPLVSGSPPMTYTNPNYSLKVAEIKKTLLNNILSSEKNCFNLHDTGLRIETVWNSILFENFSYDFRNALEIKAFSALDKKFHELQWELELFMFEYIQGRKCELMKIRKGKELQEVWKLHTAAITDVLHEKSEMMIDTFQSFIDDDALKNVMIKWKQTYILRIPNYLESLAKKSELDLLTIREEIDHSRKYDDVIQECKRRVNDLASELADKFRNGEYQEQDRLAKFNNEWVIWLAEFSTKSRPDFGSVLDQIISIIKERNIINKTNMTELENITYENCLQLTSLQGGISDKDIKDNHISRYQDALGFPKEKLGVCIHQTVNVTDKWFRMIENYLYELKLEDTKFEPIYMKKVLNLVDEKIKELNDDKDYKFKVLLPYKTLILTLIARYCIKEFTDLDNKYELKHSPRSKLGKYKDTAWNLFINLVESKNAAIITAGFFQEAIEDSVLTYLGDIIPGEVEKEILKMFKHSKHELMRSVMKNLVEMDVFHYFNMYISEAKIYVQQWLINFTNEKLFKNGRPNTSSTTLYYELCRPKVELVFVDIRKAVGSASSRVEGKHGNIIHQWTDSFIDSTTILPISADKLVHMKERTVTNDFLQNFLQAVLKHVDKMEENVLSQIKQTDTDTIRWKRSPYTSVFEKLWGCSEICPFCDEPCEYTDKDHLCSVKHSCRSHRPQGFVDFAWNNGEGPLLTEVCNYLIQTNNQYSLSGSNVQHKYRHYRTKFPEWEISPGNEISKYWMWVFNRYKTEIARINKAQPPNIEREFAQISVKEALDSL